VNQLPVPFSWMLLLSAVVFAVLRFAHLHWRDRRREPARAALQQDLSRVYGRLMAAQASTGELPHAPEEMPSGWCYRVVPALKTDHRLLLHENEPRQRLPRFPGEEEARTVMFTDGRLEMFTESAFERLLTGDNVLRGRLGLPELDVQGRQE